MTNIIVQLPEDIAQRLESRWKDLPRVALESLALEAYRSELLTTAELRQLLGYETGYALAGCGKSKSRRDAELSRHFLRLGKRDSQHPRDCGCQI